MSAIALTVTLILLADAVPRCQGGAFRQLLHAPNEAQATCGISSLGYQCYLQVCESIQLHWSLGGPPPGPGCSYAGADASTDGGAFNASADTLHFALVTDLAGYVALSLPSTKGKMAPADAVIGINGAAVKAYHLIDHHTYPEDPTVVLQNPATVASQTGGLTACASRPVSAVGGAGMVLSLSSPTAMNFAACNTPALQQHSMDGPHLCSASVTLVATAMAGGQQAVDSMASSKSTAVWCHGVLMMLAWVVLLPAGILSARHKWLFPEAMPTKTAAWFLWHRAVQLLGLAAFSIAFLLPWVAFGHHDGQHADALLVAHKVVGITVACLAGGQLVLALIRPNPDASNRQWWNLQHWYTGRLAAVLGVTNVLIGVKVFHDAWNVPRLAGSYTVVLLVLGAVVTTAIVLEMKKRKQESWVQLPAQELNLGRMSPSARSHPEGFPLLHRGS